jgi:hypothetical protein
MHHSAKCVRYSIGVQPASSDCPAAAVQSDDEHVGVVPAAGPGVSFQAALLLEADRFDPVQDSPGNWNIAPRVADVAGGAPKISTNFRAPKPWAVMTPLADREDDLATGRPKRGGHLPVTVFSVCARILRVAPVILEIIGPPLGERPGVDLFEILAGGAPAARLRAGVGVQAKENRPRA